MDAVRFRQLRGSFATAGTMSLPLLKLQTGLSALREGNVGKLMLLLRTPEFCKAITMVSIARSTIEREVSSLSGLVFHRRKDSIFRRARAERKFFVNWKGVQSRNHSFVMTVNIATRMRYD